MKINYLLVVLCTSVFYIVSGLESMEGFKEDEPNSHVMVYNPDFLLKSISVKESDGGRRIGLPISEVGAIWDLPIRLEKSPFEVEIRAGQKRYKVKFSRLDEDTDLFIYVRRSSEAKNGILAIKVFSECSL